jgi:hypothetical protein
MRLARLTTYRLQFCQTAGRHTLVACALWAATACGSVDPAAKSADAVVADAASTADNAAGTDTATAADAADQTAEVAAPSDLDQDGFTVAGGDCNDFNNTVYPGAREWGGDGLDSNCDGELEPAMSKDLAAAALPLMDVDMDSEISYEEFEAYCAKSAMVEGKARPGVVEVHVTCGGTSSGRGMILHSWGELFDHDCRGSNGCAGWSCVEAAEGKGRTAEVAFFDAHCDWCHTGTDNTFKLPLPEAVTDTAAALAEFPSRPDRRLLAAIAFGVQGLSPSGSAHSIMPGHIDKLSRAEMDALVQLIRDMKLVAESYAFDDGK